MKKITKAMLLEILKASCDCYSPDKTPPSDWTTGAPIPHHCDCPLYAIELPDAQDAPAARADAIAARDRLCQ